MRDLVKEYNELKKPDGVIEVPALGILAIWTNACPSVAFDATTTSDCQPKMSTWSSPRSTQ